MTLTDQSTRIRDGEELDASVIDQYLKAHIPGLTGTPNKIGRASCRERV